MDEKKHLPDPKSWDRFWAKDYQKLGHKKSWSKRRIESLLQSCPAPEFKVLDAGCGSGYFSKVFCDWGWDAVALDYSEEALHVSRQMTEDRAQVMRADLVGENLQERFPGQDVSLIFSDGLLEHFERDDQDRILQNFYSVLDANGVVLTVVPNRWSPWQLVRPLFMPGIQELPFILSGLVELHKRNGFKVVKSGGLNVLPFRFSPEFLGSAFGMLLYVIAKREDY